MVSLLPDGYIAHDFQINTEYGVFRDSIVMTKAEYDSMTQEQINAMEQQRVDNWIAFITESSTPPLEQQEQ